ncbi:MAG TPA: DNA-directed RNA polymerase subunit omega [Verrucomicrobiae bacterium]|nr:DNA-directed RNA polymerase subunit omega [Verrucomicrobiae bacterium]
MKAEIVKKALEKVGNPNVLVNLVSRRVRQLNTGGGGNRPLLMDTTGLGMGDIAMVEIIEDKMAWEAALVPDNNPAPKGKRAKG